MCAARFTWPFHWTRHATLATRLGVVFWGERSQSSVPGNGNMESSSYRWPGTQRVALPGNGDRESAPFPVTVTGPPFVTMLRRTLVSYHLGSKIGTGRARLWQQGHGEKVVRMYGRFPRPPAGLANGVRGCMRIDAKTFLPCAGDQPAAAICISSALQGIVCPPWGD